MKIRRASASRGGLLRKAGLATVALAALTVGMVEPASAADPIIQGFGHNNGQQVIGTYGITVYGGSINSTAYYYKSTAYYDYANQ